MKRVNFESYANSIAMAYNKGIEETDNYRELAKARKITLPDNTDERQVAEIESSKQIEKINKIIFDTESKVNEIIADYEKQENDFFTLDGKSINDDDLKLLQLPLSKSDVKALQEKYADNTTMLKAINDYARKNNLEEKILQPKESRIENLKQYQKFLRPRFLEKAKNETGGFNVSFLESAEKLKTMVTKNIF